MIDGNNDRQLKPTGSMMRMDSTSSSSSSLQDAVSSSASSASPTTSSSSSSSSRSRSGSTQDALYLLFNFASTVAVIFINKAVFSRIDFGYPAMLCNIHFIITWLGVEFMRRFGCFEPIKTKKLNGMMFNINFAVLALVVGLVTPLNNTSLKLNSVGFYQIFKLLVTPVVVMLDFCLDGKVLSHSRQFCLVLVCVFVMVSSRGDMAFSTTGTICAVIWVPLAAAYKVQWGRVKKMFGCSTLALMHAVLPFALIVQLCISPLVDPPGILSFKWTPESIFWIGLSGVAAFLVNFSGFLVMGNIGALAHVLLGQLKTAVVMVGAYFLFETHYSAVQLLGATGAVAAIVAYTHVTVQEKTMQQWKEMKSPSIDDDKSVGSNELTLPLVQKN